MSLRIDFERPPNAPSDLTSAANAERLWIAEEMLDPETLNEPEGLVSLVWELVRMVGFAYAQRIGIESRGNGVAFVEAMGCWLQYLRFVKHGEFPADELAIPTGNDLLSLGKLAGWAAAGDARALTRLEELEGDARNLATSILEILAKIPLAAPVHLLDGTAENRPH